MPHVVFLVFIVSSLLLGQTGNAAFTLPLWFSVYAIAAYAPLRIGLITVTAGWVLSTALKLGLALRGGLKVALPELRTFLEIDGDIEVVAEASNGREAVERALRLRPDVVLIDVCMPGGDGLTATAKLAGPDAAQPIPVVVITTFDLDEYVFGALENGGCRVPAQGHRSGTPDPCGARCRGRRRAGVPAVTGRVIREFARRRGPSSSGRCF